MRFFSLFSIPSSYDTYHLTILKNSLSLTCNPDKLGQLSTPCTPRENQLSHGGTFPYFKQASSPSSCFRFSKQSCDFFSLFQVGILRVDKNFTWNLSFLGLRALPCCYLKQGLWSSGEFCTFSQVSWAVGDRRKLTALPSNMVAAFQELNSHTWLPN